MGTLNHLIRMNGRLLRKKAQYLMMRNVLPLSPYQYHAMHEGPKVFANSIPKAGTNLLSQLLKQIPNIVPQWTYHIDETLPAYISQLNSIKNGQVVTAHLTWDEKLAKLLVEGQFRKFLIVRDLRDVMVSGCYYVTYMDTSHPLHGYFNSLETDAERLMAYIRGVREQDYPLGKRPEKWVDDYIKGFLPWVDDPDCMLIHFEDLIGSAGGGHDDVQRLVITRVLMHLGIEACDKALDKICLNVFSTGSRTFRQGKIADWKNHFTANHKRAFKERMGQSLVQMGYEDNYDW